MLINVHLFYGSPGKADVERRALEAYATARWADLRGDDQHAYARDIIPLDHHARLAVREGTDSCLEPTATAAVVGSLLPANAAFVTNDTTICNHHHHAAASFAPTTSTYDESHETAALPCSHSFQQQQQSQELLVGQHDDES